MLASETVHWGVEVLGITAPATALNRLSGSYVILRDLFRRLQISVNCSTKENKKVIVTEYY